MMTGAASLSSSLSSTSSSMCGGAVTVAEDHFASSSSVASSPSTPTRRSSFTQSQQQSQNQRRSQKFSSLSKQVLVELAGSQENMLKKYREALAIEKAKVRSLEKAADAHERRAADIRVALLSASAEQRAMEMQLRRKIEALSERLRTAEEAAEKERGKAKTPCRGRQRKVATRDATVQCTIPRVNAPWVEVEHAPRAATDGYTQLYATQPGRRRSRAAQPSSSSAATAAAPSISLDTPIIQHLLKCWEEATSDGRISSASPEQSAGQGTEAQLNSFFGGKADAGTATPTQCLVRLFGSICRGRVSSKQFIELNHLPKEISEGFLLHLFPLLEAHRPDIKVRAFRRVRDVYDVKLSVEPARESFGSGGTPKALPLAPSPSCRLCREMFFCAKKENESAWRTFNKVSAYEYCLRCADIVESMVSERGELYRKSTLITKDVIDHQRLIHAKTQRFAAVRRSTPISRTPPRPRQVKKNNHGKRLAVIE